MILPEIGEDGQQKLKQAKVLIVGVGGLGSPIALYLTGAGVGCIGLVDDDVVSISNLQRQVLYSEKELGKPKAICAAERLSALNSEITIRPDSCPWSCSPPRSCADRGSQQDGSGQLVAGGRVGPGPSVMVCVPMPHGDH